MRLPFLSGGYSSRSRSEPGTVAFPRRKAWDLFWVRVESHEKESRTCDRKMRGRKMREGDTWPEPGKVNHSSALIFTNLRLAEISGDECSRHEVAIVNTYMEKCTIPELSPAFRRRYSTEAGATRVACLGLKALRTMEPTWESQSGGSARIE